MTDQKSHQLLEITGQDLALLLKQTILTFCQMNVAYRNKLEVVGSIHIKADEVEISSFLLQENCLNGSTQPVAQVKPDEEVEALDSSKDKEAGAEEGFLVAGANGDEQDGTDGKSDKDSKSENGENGEAEKNGSDDGEDNVMETETSKDTSEKADQKDGDEDVDGDENGSQKDGLVSDVTTREKDTGSGDEESDSGNAGDADKKSESSVSPAPATTHASIAKQLTGASLAAGGSSGMNPGHRPVTMMVNGSHQMMRAGLQHMMRHSNVVTSSAGSMGPRMMPHTAMAMAMGAAQMAMHPQHHMFLPSHHHGGVPRPTHLSRAAIESIYRQNPPLTNRTVNLAAAGTAYHQSMAAARSGAMMRHPQIHMMPGRPAGLVCPLCMAQFPSQDQYLRHLSTHQRPSVF